MGHRQKGKGKKRKRSWHRLPNQDRLYRQALERHAQQAVNRLVEQGEIDDDSTNPVA